MGRHRSNCAVAAERHKDAAYRAVSTMVAPIVSTASRTPQKIDDHQSMSHMQSSSSSNPLPGQPLESPPPSRGSLMSQSTLGSRPMSAASMLSEDSTSFGSPMMMRMS